MSRRAQPQPAPGGAVEIVPGCLDDELLDLLRHQTSQSEPLHTRLPSEVRYKIGQRVRSVDVGIAICADDQEGSLRRPAQDMTQQQQRRPRCPMQVIEHQHRARAPADRSQQGCHRLEQSEAFTPRITDDRRIETRDYLAESAAKAQQLPRLRAQAISQPPYLLCGASAMLALGSPAVLAWLIAPCHLMTWGVLPPVPSGATRPLMGTCD